MRIIERAIETKGVIEKGRHILLDDDVPFEVNSRVKVILLASETMEANEEQWLKAASKNEAFSFLAYPEEDIYTKNDGKPFRLHAAG